MGPREFQLVLLRRMADFQPGMVEDAVRALGSSRTEMREANRRWQAMAHAARAPRGARRHTAVLGPAASVGDRAVGDLVCRSHRWPVDLWPGLSFEVVTVPGGAVVQEWLVRDGAVGGTGAGGGGDAAAPRPRTAAELVPWSYVVDDVARAFAPARPLEGTAPSRWRLAFDAPEGAPDGPPRRHIADFTWGLLQQVTPSDTP
ncbi:hypothetical protein ACFO4E_15970 [Nocardiopsis mangrovi]|uniref:Uncharacterized protein n=1 Tax=Nocardiopsis mangrovi TaxID=1179818 RepID=A0ABV9DZ28_9ACTN